MAHPREALSSYHTSEGRPSRHCSIVCVPPFTALPTDGKSAVSLAGGSVETHDSGVAAIPMRESTCGAVAFSYPQTGSASLNVTKILASQDSVFECASKTSIGRNRTFFLFLFPRGDKTNRECVLRSMAC